MGYERTLSADVTHETYERTQELADRRGVNASEVVRAAINDHLAEYQEQSLMRSFFKVAAIGLSVTALVAFSYGTAIGYPRPAVLGAWIMVPALISLALWDSWPGIAKRLGWDAGSTTSGA